MGRHADRPTGPATLTGAERRRRVRTRFDAEGSSEFRRRAGSPLAELRRTLLERFLERNLRDVPGPVLEVGPGPGRLTPTILRSGAPTVLLDLSRPMLRSARRNVARGPRSRRPWGYVRGVAERGVPFRSSSFGGVVALGVFGLLADGGPDLLCSSARILRPGGRLVLEAQGPSNSVVENLTRPGPVHARAVRTFYADAGRHYLWKVLREGFQPYDPEHFANFEYRFWRPHELFELLGGFGFDVTEAMAVAPNHTTDPDTVRAVHRDPRAWRNLLRSEEEMGHWSECLGAGATYLVAAEKGAPRAAPGNRSPKAPPGD